MRIYAAFIILTLMAFFATPISAADKQVGPTTPTPGWNLSTCDRVVSPGQSIQAAVNQANAGDKICVKNGTYHETVTIAKNNIHLIGQDARYTILDGQFTLPGGAPQGPFPKDGTKCREDQAAAKGPAYNHACSVYAGLVQVEGNNVTIEGFKIFRSRGRGIRIWRCDTKNDTCLVKNTMLRHLRIDYTRKTSIYFRIASYPTVAYSDLSRGSSHTEYHRSSYELNHGASGIGYQGTDNALVTNSAMHEGWGESIIADGTDLGSRNFTVQDNILYDNWAGLYFHGLQNALLQRNLFYNSIDTNNDDLNGILFAITKSEPNFINQGESENIVVINNIIASENESPRINSGAVVGGVIHVYMYNNLFYSRNSTDPTLHIGGNIHDFNIINNIFYHAKGATTLANISSSTLLNQYSHNCFSDSGTARLSSSTNITNCQPQFLGSDGKGTIPPLRRHQVQAEWFQLRSNSPLINKGKNIPVNQITYGNKDRYIINDYFLLSRPANSTFDIGPHEFSGTQVTIQPLPWDLNNDSKVDLYDFTAFIPRFRLNFSFPDIFSLATSL